MATLVLTLDCGCAFTMHDGRPIELPQGARWERMLLAAVYEHDCPKRDGAIRSDKSKRIGRSG